jgi:hypothetical protein
MINVLAFRENGRNFSFCRRTLCATGYSPTPSNNHKIVHIDLLLGRRKNRGIHLQSLSAGTDHGAECDGWLLTDDYLEDGRPEGLEAHPAAEGLGTYLDRYLAV